MQSVTLIRDPLAPPSGYERALVPDVRAFLMERFDEWPASARIYHGLPAMDHDVTPASERDVERLAEFDELTVVVFPGHPGLLLIIMLVIAVLTVVATLLLMPKIPSLENQQQPSPNNGLGSRENKPRPNGRIPDIFGTLRSIPDMLGVPYRVYDDHRELEISYMCIGRGQYDVSDVRDGDTLISQIDLASAAIYGPYSSPNDGTLPQLLIGTAIGDPVFNVAKLNGVNGQTLLSPNNKAVATTQDLRFVDGGIIRSASGAIDFSSYFHVGDFVDIDNAHDVGGDVGTSGIQAAATAHSGGFDFASYNPTADFTVGKWISIIGAVYQIDDGGTPGTIAGGTSYPDPTYDPYSRCIDWLEPILMANAARDGPGEAQPMHACQPGQFVWTQHEHTLDWGAYEIEALLFAVEPVWQSDDGLPIATAAHRFRMAGTWVRMDEIGREAGETTVGKMSVRDARTYVSVRPSGRLVLNHNIKMVTE